MFPPILEIYVLWHPKDLQGRSVATAIFDHYHGTQYCGLLGGAVEVCVRSDSWDLGDGPPRPIPLAPTALPNGLLSAKFAAVVPLVGNELATEVEKRTAWHAYLSALLSARQAHKDSVFMAPFELDMDALKAPEVSSLLGGLQRLGNSHITPEPPIPQLCRDLSQGIAQLIGGPGNQRLRVFISHTKRAGSGESGTAPLINTVRTIISETRLAQFFDANDLQPGQEWDDALRQAAGTSALLALRTDLYSSREWCQREMRIAKEHGMPIVVLDCVTTGEERGSFLMDHVPRLPVRYLGPGTWSENQVRVGLNHLVDECLKRELWRSQQATVSTKAKLDISWWAPHAPEPLTLLQWLKENKACSTPLAASAPMRILHPDPPLGADEASSLGDLVRMAGHMGPVEIMTPRMWAARGGTA